VPQARGLEGDSGTVRRVRSQGRHTGSVFPCAASEALSEPYGKNSRGAFAEITFAGQLFRRRLAAPEKESQEEGEPAGHRLWVPDRVQDRR
jgi:hypothetical protein